MRCSVLYGLSLLLIGTVLGRDPGLAVAEEVAPKGTPEQAIQYLVEFVAQSKWTFIRNGREYTGKEASEHMVRKYRHFQEKIHTPEDFVRLAATKSLVSGKPYLVRNEQGAEMRSEAWLLDVLREYRKTRGIRGTGHEEPPE